MINVATTSTIPMDAEFTHALTLVGQLVTYANSQFTVHSVEGDTWYAFNQDGQITFDTGMTPRWLKSEAQVTLIPSGSHLGYGDSVNVPMSWVRRGVSLRHEGRSEW